MNKEINMYNTNMYHINASKHITSFEKTILQKFYDNKIKYLPKYEDLYNKINNDSYEWLKIQYSDICTCGDKIINSILDEMYNLKNYEIDYDEIENNKEEYNYYYDHILESYEDYMSGIDCDPLWAD